MPISPLVLQRRHAEVGRIRLGNQVPTGKDGKTRPNKLTKFRFTSSSEEYIRELATLYGGEPKPWQNGSKSEWEVFSDAKSIDVVVLKGGLSQWLETWSGGGVIHRCDGIRNVLNDELCEDDQTTVVINRKTIRAHDAAKPTTRITMMLRDLQAIGGWRMESHGWNAAAEIPAIAELAQVVGEMVPAVLHLVERTSVKDGQTSQFVVPVLDLKIGSQRLNEIIAAKMGEPLALAGGTEAPALPAGSSAPAVPNYLEQAQQCSTQAAVGAIWRTAHNAGHLTEQLAAELKLVGDALGTPSGPDADGAYDAEVVDEAGGPDADQVWQQIVAAAGVQGMGLPDLHLAYSEFSGGGTAAAASAEDLRRFLTLLATGEQVSA